MKRTLSTLLAIIMLLGAMSTLTNVFAMNYVFNAKDYTTKYVCVKEERKSYDFFGDDNQITTRKYDSKGNVVREKISNTDDGSYTLSEFKYDDNGNMTYKLVKEKNDYNYFEHANAWTFDSNNKITKHITGEPDTLKKNPLTTEKFYYGSNGKLSRIYTKAVDINGKNTSKIYDYYTYDSNGNLIKNVNESEGIPIIEIYKYNSKNYMTKSTLASDGVVLSVTTNKYDSKGNVIKKKIIWKHDDGKIYDSRTSYYSYDKNGNLTNEKEYLEYDSYGNNEKTKAIRIYKQKFDSNNNVISEKYINNYSDGYNSESSIKYSYNSKGKITKKVEIEKSSDGTNSNYTTTYKYDKYGNLTKKTVYSDNKKESSTTYTYKKLSKPICEMKVYGYTIRMSNSSYTYNGKAKKPNFRLTDYLLYGNESQYHLKDVHYAVTYKNNVKPGTAQAIISISDENDTKIIINYEIKPAKAK